MGETADIRAHALLSASGANRWLHCPPSARLEDTFPESTSDYADEGTFAHKLAEFLLRKKFTVIPKSKSTTEYSALKQDPYYSVGLEDYVQTFVDYVTERYNEARAVCPDAMILMEQKLDFSKWVPDGFGTGDVVIIADGTMEVIDLKYGKGVVVAAEDNPQLRLYGLGALEVFSHLFDIENVTMTIHQPRLDAVSSETIDAAEMYLWATTIIAPIAELAFRGEGNFCVGDHCKFCRAKAVCRARAEQNLELAKYEFRLPPILDNDEIPYILAILDQLTSWAKDIEDYALKQAVDHGVRWDGWKLVEGRSNRKYADQDQVAQTLRDAGFDDAIIYEKILLGITKMEETIGKKIFNQHLAELVIKPAGKPVLVPVSDKRTEISSTESAAADFE